MRVSSIGAVVAVGVLLSSAACQVDDIGDREAQGATQQPVVYGDDDRTEYYAHTDDDLRRLTRESIVALIPASSLNTSNPNDIQVSATSLQDYYNLCDDQRFLDQPTAANCSATLIDDDLVLTAGHCVTSQSSCQSYRYVFNYFYESEGELATITSDDVYECQELVVQAYTSSIDYAILQLDRPVSADHRPAPVRVGDEPLTQWESVPVIGFGSGLPAKIDDGGRVSDAREGTLDYFMLTGDTFGGNSGSGIFDASGQVVGILVRGETDYVSRGSCSIVNELSDPPTSGQGEDGTYVARAIVDLCEVEEYPSARLCSGASGEGWCDPCESVSECPDGWECRSTTTAGELGCAFACSGDDDCREDHHCGDDGYCAPDLSPRCYSGDVWNYDACRRRVAIADDCAADELCSDGVCVERPGGDTCADPEIIQATNQTLTGDLELGFANDYTGSCAGAGPDRVFQFNLAEQRRFEAVATGFDTVLYVRQTCTNSGSEVACNDDATPPGSYGSRIARNLDSGTYFLFLDAYGSGVGDYEIEITFSEPPEPPAGDNCSNPTAIDSVSQRLTGNLGGDYVDDYRGGCGGNGPERVFSFTVDSPLDLVAEASGFDTLIYLRRACTDASTQVACNDDATPPGNYGSHFEVSLSSGDYYLFMDAYSGTVGNYTLDLEFSPSCIGGCDVGELRCQGEGYQTCEADANGCGTWGAVVACDEGEFCEAGVCMVSCVDDCAAAGLRECLSDSSYRVCGQFDDDDCLDWGRASACETGTVCEEGACVPDCDNECSLDGLNQCVGTTRVQTCGDFDDDVCLEWSDPTSCADGDVCESGLCVCADACVDGESQCDDEGLPESCQLADDGCFDWITLSPCDDGFVCAEGACIELCGEECTPDETRCVEDGSGVQECLIDELGCTVWGDEIACETDEICLEGACVVACMDDCSAEGELVCVDESSFQTCGQYDDDDCLDLSGVFDCDPEQLCSDDIGCSAECADDGFEPNNLADDAIEVEEGAIEDLLVCATDEDWFSIVVDADLELVVEVDHDVELSDIDLELLLATDLSLLVGSYGDETTPLARVEVEESTDVLARVFLFSGTEADYDITFNLQPASTSECDAGDRRCNEARDGVQKCLDEDGDGDFEWTESDLCGIARTCIDPGYCVGGISGLEDMGDAPDLAAPDAGANLDGRDGCGCNEAPNRTPVTGALMLAALFAAGVIRRRSRREESA